ncbi:MAG: DegT/DnrJ/EryC1/StrS family aminotransferase, partial [bacterium]
MITSAHPSLRFADLWRRSAPAARALLRAPGLYKTYNGRGALYQVFRAIRKQRSGVVLVPAFHCPTVIDPVLEAGFEVAFYGVRSNLTIDEADLWARAHGDVAAVIAIHYLGFPTDLNAPLALRRERGCLVVEDCAHSFLRATPVALAGEGGDAAVYSFYKLVPTYAGGAFQIRSSAVSWSGSLHPVPVGHAT